MNKIKRKNKVTLDSIKSVNQILKCMLYGALIVSVLMVFLPLFMNGLELPLESDQGEILIKPEELSFKNRVIFSLLYSLTLYFWIFGLLWLLRLSRRFSVGEIFSKKNSTCVKMFAYSLILMALVNPVYDVFVSHYLYSIGHMASKIQFDVFNILGQMDYLISAVAILLICAVFDKAVELSEESKFTI